MLLLLACVPDLKAPQIADNPNHDFDGDGYTEREGDCDDAYPGSPEVCDDGADGGCDGDPGAACLPEGPLPLSEVDGHLRFTDGGSFGAALDVSDDADGDGWLDLVVGNPTYANNREVVVGGAGLYGGAFDEDRQTNNLLWKNTEADAAGWAVAHIGDYRGDGRIGWALGLPAYDEGDATGCYYVVSSDGDLIDGAIGGDPGWALGAAVDGVPDLDGDGRPEVLVGAPGVDGAYIHDVDLQRNMGLIGADGSRVGATVHASPDLDGDGAVDVVVAGPEASGDDGLAYVQLGPLDWRDPIRMDNEGVALRGSSGERLGASASSGDLDGDGLDDVAIGAPGRDGKAGAVYIFLSPPDEDHLGSWARLDGEGGNDLAGAAVVVMPDFDGDGGADLAVGAPGTDGGKGAVYLVIGPGEGTASLGDARATLLGESSLDLAGTALAAGDLNQDGRSDLVIGAPGEGKGGSVHVLLGGGL